MRKWRRTVFTSGFSCGEYIYWFSSSDMPDIIKVSVRASCPLPPPLVLCFRLCLQSRTAAFLPPAVGDVVVCDCYSSLFFFFFFCYRAHHHNQTASTPQHSTRHAGLPSASPCSPTREYPPAKHTHTHTPAEGNHPAMLLASIQSSSKIQLSQ